MFSLTLSHFVFSSLSKGDAHILFCRYQLQWPRAPTLQGISLYARCDAALWRAGQVGFTCTQGRSLPLSCSGLALLSHWIWTQVSWCSCLPSATVAPMAGQLPSRQQVYSRMTEQIIYPKHYKLIKRRGHQGCWGLLWLQCSRDWQWETSLRKWHESKLLCLCEECSGHRGPNAECELFLAEWRGRGWRSCKEINREARS